MNMLQRNPRDPKHREFHDGEYEYWPAQSPASSKSSSFPAAVLNGLEMLAAALAAAVLAALLMVMYTLSSPLSISEDHAIVNVNVYNNVDGRDVQYTLSLASDPDTVLQKGTLEDDEHTLELYGLMPGSRYLLQYLSLKDGSWEFIGDFHFVTPGDPPGQPTLPPEVPPAHESSGEPEGQEEASAEPSETTEETAETQETAPDETTGITEPPFIWNPPGPTPRPEPEPEPDYPDPGPETEPVTEPTTEPTIEPEPTIDPSVPPPEALGVEVGEVAYVVGDASGLAYDRYVFTQYHYIDNVPDGGYQNIQVTHNGNPVTDFTASIDYGGLSVVVRGLESRIYEVPDNADTVTTTVTVTWANGTTTVSTHTLMPPSLKSVSLSVEPTGNTNERIFTTTVTADPGSGEFRLRFHDVWLYMVDASDNYSYELISEPISLSSTDDPCVYTHTKTVTIPPQYSGRELTATVYVNAIWNMVPDYDTSTSYHKDSSVTYSLDEEEIP